MALTSFALRYPAGRLVDGAGPRAVALPTAALQAAGALLAASAHSLEMVLVAGVLLGAAWAAVVPVTVGLLFEHSASATRGAAMGAYNLAFSGGAACGAVLAAGATLLGSGYGLAMSLCACASLASLPLVLRTSAPRRELVAARGGAAGD
jgi:MFS family permease